MSVLQEQGLILLENLSFIRKKCFLMFKTNRNGRKNQRMTIYLKCLQNITKLPTENKNHIDKLSERKIS